MNIGIIGCGLIGEKRAKCLNSDLIACFDIDKERAYKFGEKFNCSSYDSIEDFLNSNVDTVIVSTTNKSLYPSALKAINHKKNVLIEKPAGINSNEIREMIIKSRENSVIVQIGFNHRYHPSINKAKEIISNKEIGELMFIRANYGHGGRLGYDKEWRSKKAEGGGELIDQGVHLIDLSTWFFEESFLKIDGKVKNYFWDMEVEDNAFMMLETPTGKVAFLNASCTEWKNEFSFDIYGKTGRISLRGLGGSYGTETLTVYNMYPEMGIPDTYIYEYRGEDGSWFTEWNKFLESIEHHSIPEASLYDALEVMLIVEEIKK